MALLQGNMMELDSHTDYDVKTLVMPIDSGVGRAAL